jgi:tetratricopeptide (TPR) repeat protein
MPFGEPEGPDRKVQPMSSVIENKAALDKADTVSGDGLCPCRSGLSAARCCDLKEVQTLSADQLGQYASRLEQARAARDAGRTDEAAALCVDILEQAPAHQAALDILYRLRAEANERKPAEALLSRLVKLDPNNLENTQELAMMLYKRRELGEAEHHARNCIRLGPRHPQSHNLLGMVLTDIGRTHAGEYHYRMALKLHEPLGKLLANLGLNLRNQGKLEEARECYREAAHMEPDNIHSLLGWVKLEETARDFPRAWELLERIERIDPHIAETVMIRATLHTREKRYDEAIAVLDGFEANQGTERLGSGYHIHRAGILDKMGRYDEAFACYDRANRITRNAGRGIYDEARSQRLARHLKRFFTRSRMEILPRATARDDIAQPLFIIGFPRSGTTMTEQILTAHPDICAGDELTFIGDLSRFSPKLLNSPFGFPECLADLWMGDNQEALDTFRDFYLKRTQQLGVIEPGSRLFTDKMPLNETHLGLINLVFPDTPIVHLLRHPLDVVLSCFFTDLTHGFKMSYDLKTAAQHYMLVFDLLNHYKDNLDMRYHAVRYEDIVADQVGKTRELLDFIGLPWDERCLKFHENPRYARTASYAQVTEKLYTSSVFRFRNYRKHIEEILPILEPAITALGYPLE